MKKIIPIIGLSTALLLGGIHSKEVQADESVNGWHLVDGEPKYFEDGDFLTGLQTVGKTTYLFDGNGIKQTGWHKLDNKDYFFDPDSNGGMVTGKRKIGNTTYLMHNDGYKSYGWHKLDGKEYYFDANYGGGMVTGKRKIGSTTYLMHNDGYKTYGWHQLDGKAYYFDADFGGGMVTGKRKLGNTTYLMHNDGYKMYGWSLLDGKEYYFDPNFSGGMLTGEREVRNSVYLFDDDGAKLKLISTVEDGAFVPGLPAGITVTSEYSDGIEFSVSNKSLPGGGTIQSGGVDLVNKYVVFMGNDNEGDFYGAGFSRAGLEYIGNYPSLSEADNALLRELGGQLLVAYGM